jgi:hypothetical protein
MSFDATETRYTSNQRLFVSAVGTPVPDDTETAWETVDPAWVELGYFDTDGQSITPNVETNDINADQSFQPLYKPVKSAGFEITVNLMQHNKEVTSLYFFGAEWTNNANNKSRLLLPAAPTLPEYSFGLEWVDNFDEVNRLVIYRAAVTNREALKLQRAEAIMFGVTIEALAAPDGVSFGEWISDNLDLNPTS